MTKMPVVKIEQFDRCDKLTETRDVKSQNL